MGEKLNGHREVDDSPALDSFSSWAVRHWKRTLAIFGTFALPFPFTAVLGFLSGVWPSLQPYRDVSHLLLNLITILLLLLFFLNPPLTDRAQFPRESTAVENFSKWWHLLWIMWFIQYFLMVVTNFPMFEAPGEGQVELIGLLELLKGASTIPPTNWFLIITALGAVAFSINAMLVLCYLSLALYSNPGKRVGGLVGVLFFILFIPNLVPLLLSAGGHLSEAALSKATLLTPLLYGTIACVSMALIVGRLESRVIAPPLAIVVLLYVYAALLFAGNVLHTAEAAPMLDADTKRMAYTIFQIVSLVAAFLKAIFFLLVYWLLHSGVLLYYMHWMLNAKNGTTGIDAERKGFVLRLHLGSGQNSV